MGFTKFIKTISATLAGIAVFLMASGMYLSSKGFEILPSGEIVLVKTAQAAQDKTIAPDVSLPQKHILGLAEAKIKLYEYSSFGCYYCAEFHTQILPKLPQLN